MNNVKFRKKIVMIGGLMAILSLSQTVRAGEMPLAKHRGEIRHGERELNKHGRQDRSWRHFRQERHGPFHPYINVEESRLIRRLPFRAEKVYLNGIAFYYYNGLFYRPQDYGYIRVTAPTGICVTHLPAGHHVIALREGPAYEHNGHFYVKYHGKYKVISPFSPFVRPWPGEKKWQ
ncbi:MAG: DUF6515 family protein [Candidatus Omnitrophota bacterium]